MIIRSVGVVSSILLRQAKQASQVSSDTVVNRQEERSTMRRISLPAPPAITPKDFTRSPLGPAIRKGSIFDRVGPTDESSGRSRKLSVVWSKTTPGG